MTTDDTRLEASLVLSSTALCGEGPVWDAPRGRVCWVDIVGKQVFATDYESGATRAVSFATMVGAAAPRVSGGWILATEDGFCAVSETGEPGESRTILEQDVRMNDAKVDQRGRLWSGSCAYDFATGRGALWRIGSSWEPELILGGLTQPNGLGWSPDGATFYLVDTQARNVTAWSMDEHGDLRDDRRVIVGSAGFGHGYPDGLTVDARGHLWIAVYGGGEVQEYEPTGSLVRVVRVPVSQPTSCAFVGPDLDDLWVTSAADGTDPAREPLAGSVLRVHGHGTRGLPQAAFGG